MKMDVFSQAEAALAALPKNATAVLLMRHGEKEGIPRKMQPRNHPGVHDLDRLLTEHGKAESETMGRLLMDKIVRIEHSQVQRCRQTAEHMALGAQFTGQLVENPTLVGEGYVPSHDALRQAKKAVGGFTELVDCLAVNDGYAGFNSTRASTLAMLSRLWSKAESGINVGVSHDWILYLALYALGIEKKSFFDARVKYLEPLFLWQEDGRVFFHYRHARGECDFSHGELMEKSQ